jgi:PAS domain S-box-containing protein
MSTAIPGKTPPWTLIGVFCLLAGAISWAGYGFYQHQKEQLENQKLAEIQAVANLKVGQIVAWRQERLADARVIAATPFLGEHLRHLIEQPEELPGRKNLWAWLTTVKERYRYQSVLLLNGRGEVLLSAGEDSESISASEENLVAEVIQQPRLLFSEFYRPAAAKCPRLSLLAPVLEQQNGNTEVLGILFFRLDPGEFLFPLIQSWPTPSPTAETLLVRREGDEAVFLNELRHQQDTALSLRFPLTKTDLPAVQAALGREGAVWGEDYRGVRVLAAVRQIPASPWVLVSKEDETEIFAGLEKYALYTGSMVATLILATFLACAFLWRQLGMQYVLGLAHQEKEQRQQLDVMLSATPDQMYLIDREGRYRFANRAAVQALGLDPEELVGQNLKDRGFPPDIGARLAAEIDAVFTSRQPRRGESSFALGGKERFFDYILTPLSGGTGTDCPVLVVLREITERKQAEEAIRIRLTYEQALVQISTWAVEADDLSRFQDDCLNLLGKIQDVSRAYIFEHRHETDTMDDAFEWVAPGVTPQKDSLQDVPASAVPWWVETLKEGRDIRFADIEDIPDKGAKDILRPQNILSILVVPLFIGKRYYGFMGFDECRRHREWVQEDVDLLFTIGRIITEVIERQRAEEALREAEARYRRIVDTANEGILAMDSLHRTTYVNQIMADMLGYSPEEMLGQAVIAFMFPEDLEDHREKMRRRQQGLDDKYERRFRRKDGTDLWTIVSARALVDEQGIFQGSFAMFTDITARKRAEELIRLRVSLLDYAATHSLEELLQKTLDEIGALTGSPIGFYHFVHPDQETLSLQAWSTRTLEEFCRAKGKGLHYRIDQAGVWVDCVHARQPVIHNDYASLPHRRGLPEGHPPVIRELVVPIIREGLVMAILGVGNKSSDYTAEDVSLITYAADVAWEITQRKRAEEALRESEEQYRLLVQTIPAVVARGYEDWSVDVFDEKIEGLTGYPPEVFNRRQRKWDELILPEDLPHCRDIFRAALKSRAPYVREYRIRTRGGEIRWLQERSQLLFQDDGALKLVSGVLFDITELKRAEERLKASLQEKEVLLKEIHHRVKNNMQIISSLLRLQSDRVSHPEVQGVFQESQNRIRSMALVHEMLYRSPDLASIPLAVYLRDLVNGLFRSFRVDAQQISLTLEVADISLGIDLALSCGLIITELVSNTLKHAFPHNRSGEVSIIASESAVGVIELAVRDTGVGLPADLDFRKTSSLGLRLVTLLAGQINGSVEMDRAAGTTFVIRFPVKEGQSHG